MCAEWGIAVESEKLLPESTFDKMRLLGETVLAGVDDEVCEQGMVECEGGGVVGGDVQDGAVQKCVQIGGLQWSVGDMMRDREQAGIAGDMMRDREQSGIAGDGCEHEQAVIAGDGAGCDVVDTDGVGQVTIVDGSISGLGDQCAGEEGVGGVRHGGDDEVDVGARGYIVGVKGSAVIDIVSNFCIRSFTQVRTEDERRRTGSSTGSPGSRRPRQCSSGKTPSSPLRRARGSDRRISKENRRTTTLGGGGTSSFLNMAAASFQGVNNLVNMYQGLSNTRPEKVKMTNEHQYAVGSEQLYEDGQ